jgi:hypothetical protein
MWLRLASWGWDQPQTTIEGREHVRRSQLLAWIALGILFAGLLLLPLGDGDTAALTAVAVTELGLVIAVVLNRRGYVNASGTLITVLIIGAVFGGLVGETAGLALDNLPSYDLLAVAVIVAASILPRRSAFVVALVNAALISLDFWFQPHATDLATELNSYPSVLIGSVSLLARPVALQIVIAVVAFLWVRGTDNALHRADQAEELAALEHAIAEERRALERDVQSLLMTHVRVSNGDFNARPGQMQSRELWQVASSLNNLLNRLQKLAQADFQLHRAEQEMQRLIAAVQDMQSGRQPIWPAPSGSIIDPLIMLLAQGRPGPGSSPMDYDQTGMRAPVPHQAPSGPNGERQEGWQSPPWSQPASQPPRSAGQYPAGWSDSVSGPVDHDSPELPWWLDPDSAHDRRS